ncbi:MAG TPA: alpha-ketoglutarate-dependent dioxygenase AlkB [Candidatus Paceibacterota bacterium]|nr:alpha-ketoglutarate-dependent dioxygenase AlkB [Candidatus Paceibacterota bacterium]
MPRAGSQLTLLDTGTSLPNGFVYRPDFLTPEEETELLGYFEDLPFSHSRLGEYVAKRRIIGFGWGYDFAKEKLIPGPPLPPFLRPLQRKIGKWLDIPPARVVEALVTEYQPGSAIGWHRDNESFDSIIGISLAGWCRMRLRPLQRTGIYRNPKDVIALPLEPRSAYCMQKDSRWKYQHSIPKVETLRYSITFRTLPRSIPTPTHPVSLPLPGRRRDSRRR